MSAGFSQLIEQARAGSEEAATVLFETYQPHVMRVVRRRLAHELRSKFDSHDFAQAVWSSFFNNRHELLSTNSPEQLVSLLAVMARNKVYDEIRRRHTKKHDVHRETSIDRCATDGEGAPPLEGRLSTPSNYIIARETLDGIMEPLTDEHRQVVDLRIKGYSVKEVAEQTGLSERTVRRIVARIQARDARR